jgi:hypothetical protein
MNAFERVGQIQRSLRPGGKAFSFAKVSSRAGMEGEKKYSPPWDTTHSSGRVNFLALSSAPLIWTSRNGSPSFCWPIMASNPGPPGPGLKPGFGTLKLKRKGKPGLFAQTRQFYSTTNIGFGIREETHCSE